MLLPAVVRAETRQWCGRGLSAVLSESRTHVGCAEGCVPVIARQTACRGPYSGTSRDIRVAEPAKTLKLAARHAPILSITDKTGGGHITTPLFCPNSLKQGGRG